MAITRSQVKGWGAVLEGGKLIMPPPVQRRGLGSGQSADLRAGPPPRASPRAAGDAVTAARAAPGRSRTWRVKGPWRLPPARAPGKRDRPARHPGHRSRSDVGAERKERSADVSR